MGMTHPAITDDSGTRTDGTVWNNAWETAHDAAIDAAIAGAFTPAASAPTTTGNQTALAVPTNTGGLLATYHNNATLTTIQGMAAGQHGQLWFHYSKGAGQVDFAHLHASGTALGKLKLFATTGVTSLAAGSGVALFQYDATVGVTQWKLVTHKQGAWISAAWVAGHFTGNGTMTWGVDVGDVSCRYLLDGRTVTFTFNFATTTIGGAANTLLQISNAQWGGFTIATTATNALAFANDGTVRPGYVRATVGATLLELTTTAATAWDATGTNDGYFAGEIQFEVT